MKPASTPRRRSRLSSMTPMLLAVAVAGCAGAGGVAAGGAPATAPDPTPAPLRCTRDAECVVKDVGNCCGYYPACVHVDQAVDPEGVKRRCAEQGLSSICGFQEISSCACVEGECRPADTPL